MKLKDCYYCPLRSFNTHYWIYTCSLYPNAHPKNLICSGRYSSKRPYLRPIIVIQYELF